VPKQSHTLGIATPLARNDNEKGRNDNKKVRNAVMFIASWHRDMS